MCVCLTGVDLSGRGGGGYSGTYLSSVLSIWDGIAAALSVVLTNPSNLSGPASYCNGNQFSGGEGPTTTGPWPNGEEGRPAVDATLSGQGGQLGRRLGTSPQPETVRSEGRNRPTCACACC